MSVQNLEQLRAGNALKAASDHTFAGKGGGEIAKKIPMEIRTNGWLGSAAFALDKDEGRKAVYEKAILPHLRQRWENIPLNLEEAIQHLTSEDANFLRQITAETLAYLNYFRRFAHK